MSRHTTNRAEKPKVGTMENVIWKMAAEKRGIDRFSRTTARCPRVASAQMNDEKILENLPRVFCEEKPRGELPKTKPTKENRKDAEAAIRS